MIDMCNALEELRQEGYQEGYRRGYQEGRQEERLHSIQVVIRICQEYNKDVAVEKLIECYSLLEDEAVDYVNRYWQSGD